jgi:hypothetical protein
MAISDTDVREFYNGDGTNVDFTIPFDFELDENTQVKVYIVTVTDGVVTAALQTEGALQDYTLTGGDIPNSVNYTTVTFNTAPAASEDVLIVRSTPRTQGDSYTNSASVSNVTIMKALDYLTRLVQEVGEEADRSVKFRVGSQQVDIPIDEPTAGEFLAWAGDGLSIVSSPGELGTVTVGSGTGLLAKDSSTTTVVRTLTGTASEIDVADGDGVSGDPTVGLSDDPVVPGTGAIRVPIGTTAQRRATPNEGDLRANSETSAFEGYIGGSWGSIGGTGGGGGGGINYISDNPDFEAGTTGWATYADAAASTPADGTGGSANITLTASSSSPLRGTQSGLITKDAANRQGEGASYDFTINNADKSKTLSLSFDLEASSAFVVGDDSDVQVFIYDVTNTTLITPKVSAISGTSGQFLTTWESTDSTSYRLIFHIATTNASAWTFKFDNVNVGPREVILGPIVQDWQSYTPTFGGIGTPGDVTFWYKQIGDTLYVRGRAEAGTLAASPFTISLPSGFTIDTQKIQTEADENSFGPVFFQRDSGTSEIVADAAPGLGAVAYDGSNTDSVRVYRAATGRGFQPENANAILPTGAAFTIPALAIPIANASSNVAIGTATTFRMAPILANGTRVTATPTRLGEYRTRTKTSSSTASDAAPTDAPSSTNGMRIYSAYRAGAGGSGQINEWEIFVGKNKQVKTEFYSGTGKSGNIDIQYEVINSGGLRYRGINVNSYDPTTGILFLTAWVDTTTIEDNIGRVKTSGAQVVLQNNCYFDVIVSENAAFLGVEPQNKFQTKFLTADVTSATTVPALDFSGLTVGKTYKLTVSPMINVAGSSEDLVLSFTHNSTVILTAGLNMPNSTLGPTLEFGRSRIFTATASTISAEVTTYSGSPILRGDATALETYATIEELNNYQEVTSF